MSAIDITENSPGVEKKVMEQREKEKKGRYVRVNDKTMIFVKHGDDERLKTNEFLKKFKRKCHGK